MLRSLQAVLLLVGALLVLPGCGNDGKTVTPQIKDEIKDKAPEAVQPMQPKVPPKTGST